MGKWNRIQYLPGIGLGKGGVRVTESKEHIALSKEAAKEGMVLLKNEENALPLKRGAKVALFGKGTIDYVKGGGGSGDVTVSYVRNLYDGFRKLGNRVQIFEELAEFYQKEVMEQYAKGREPGMIKEPDLPSDLVKRARAFADTAIISISRFSGEAWDRKSAYDTKERIVECGDKGPSGTGGDLFERGDFYLSNAEEAMVEAVVSAFSQVIVVLNVGGVVDTKWFKDHKKIKSVLYASQGGMEGGLAAAELLCGIGCPSGKLSDTFAENLEDYPSSEGFHESDDFVEYTEDIFVGYRYFETIPSAGEKVVYPFGYGLSYTQFSIGCAEIVKRGDKFYVTVPVKNIGKVSGKEVVQIYACPPAGKLTKASRMLVAFAKTKLLKPRETEILKLTFDLYSLSSYDDCGAICKSAYVVEAGEYQFFVGKSVRTGRFAAYTYRVKENLTIDKLSEKLSPRQLKKRMLADGSFINVPQGDPIEPEKNILAKNEFELLEGLTPSVEPQKGWLQWHESHKVHLFSEVADGTLSMDKFLAQLSDRQLIHLLGGQPNTGVADTFGYGNIPEYGIPSFMTADGPAGLRICKDRGVCTTAWPCATLLACTFNTDIVEKVGQAGGEEIKENNIAFWLTPAVNIHRSPLCGRNFEYYSEDPYLAGKLGSAMVRGIQKNHVGACVKHFALNNKETNRKNSDSRASERAIREIYLKPFEMIVKEAKPYSVMSSYNLVNGVRTSQNHELLEDVLRGEWGFDGFVTTDWWNLAEHYKEILAGNDIKMGCGFPDRVEEAFRKGAITHDDLLRSVKRLLSVLLRID